MTNQVDINHQRPGVASAVGDQRFAALAPEQVEKRMIIVIGERYLVGVIQQVRDRAVDDRFIELVCPFTANPQNVRDECSNGAARGEDGGVLSGTLLTDHLGQGGLRPA